MWQRIIHILNYTHEDANADELKLVIRNGIQEFVKQTSDTEAKENALEVPETKIRDYSISRDSLDDDTV